MRACLAQADVDLVLLDLGLPRQHSLSLLRQSSLRAANVRVIIVSGRGELLDRVVGLEVGADDYITKPFHLQEVLARVRSVLRASDLRPVPIRPELGALRGWRDQPRDAEPEGKTEPDQPPVEQCRLSRRASRTTRHDHARQKERRRSRFRIGDRGGAVPSQHMAACLNFAGPAGDANKSRHGQRRRAAALASAELERRNLRCFGRSNGEQRSDRHFAGSRSFQVAPMIIATRSFWTPVADRHLADACDPAA